MPALVGDNLDKFAKYLSETLYADKINGILTEWERLFVEGIKEHFDSREDAIDLGCNPWNPSLNQWNTLHGIWSKL